VQTGHDIIQRPPVGDNRVALRDRSGVVVGGIELSTVHFAVQHGLGSGHNLVGGGSVGDSYDNALAETINGLFKAEVIHRRGPWKSLAVEYATLEWVDWFNNRRILEPI